MEMIVEMKPSEILPDDREVLRLQGISKSACVPAHITGLLAGAKEIFLELAAPRALISKTSISSFADIYAGENQNAPENPLAMIYPQSTHLALYALTLGRPVCDRISGLFAAHDYALAAMLDAVASAAADVGVGRCEHIFAQSLAQRRGDSKKGLFVLAYSPGYCGWHLSGQKKLFAALQPERIGITLSPSCLMSPIKSVTGVLVAGRGEIHLFKPGYPFCKACKSHPCAPRLRDIRKAIA